MSTGETLACPKKSWDWAQTGIIDPGGAGPQIWFHVVPEPKAVKNALHPDICASGSRIVPIVSREQRVDAEARRLTSPGATMLRVLEEKGARPLRGRDERP
jgi:hypothetical protein